MLKNISCLTADEIWKNNNKKKFTLIIIIFLNNKELAIVRSTGQDKLPV